ncbi:MAG: hypothetical protein E7028_07295 [Planctomycetaceae bacterium]|nr:hypothetical protein [Planctomycetaceae bacterium]
MIRRDFIRFVLAGSAVAGLTSGFDTVVLGNNLPDFLKTDAGQCLPDRTVNGKAWFNCEKIPLEGRAWENEERISPYDRFPKRWMEKIPSGVRGNSLHSSGMAAHFKTNSKNIWINYENTKAHLGMWHMAPVGVSGFDLYCRDEHGTWRYFNAIQKGAKAEALIGTGIPDDGKEREYLIYFPLYNGVKMMEIGVIEGSTFSIVPQNQKPILFYGTSICHGACASRPGMPHPPVLARRLDMPFWNFGFSGCGKMEPVMAEAFSELDPSIYVLDCVPNMNAALVTERAFPFVVKLRETHPDTPILLVEDRRGPKAWMDQAAKEKHDANHAAMRTQYERMLAAGIKGLYYLEGDLLLPPDGEGTVDNSHPNDYGFYWQANAMEPVMRKALGK